MMMDMVVMIFGYHVGINANTKNRNGYFRARKTLVTYL